MLVSLIFLKIEIFVMAIILLPFALVIKRKRIGNTYPKTFKKGVIIMIVKTWIAMVLLILVLQACSSAPVYHTASDCLSWCGIAHEECKYNCTSNWKACTRECIGLAAEEALACNITCDTEYETCNHECKTKSQKCYGTCSKLRAGQ